MAPRRIQVLISGRVQGVFFRQTALEEALRLGLGGWVRNRLDGRVEAHAEGPAEAVAAFLDFCRRGPERARVDEVLVAEQVPRGETMFRVETSR
ncbi:MAG TPA: acylphosphatase [Myxococcaceae bacterium]|jgi:acylphosphatase|nr:acylphosphatase [Myxococcaceae bacterium]